jgi:hypothetical protein
MACMKYGIAPHAITEGLFIFARETSRAPGAPGASLSGRFLIHGLFIAPARGAALHPDKRSSN